MNKPSLIALLIITVVTVAAATPMVMKKSTPETDITKQSTGEDRTVERTTTITAEQAEAMKKNLERRTYEQANQHLADILRKNNQK